MTDYLFELHTAAMDFMDDAESARKKGDIVAAHKYSEKAWNLERSYALAIPNEPAFQLTRSILFRSAGWLAIDCGKYEEAMNLMKKILADDPHPDVVAQLEAVYAEAVKRTKKQKGGDFELIGTLVSADIPFNQIKIQEEKSEAIYVFLVSTKSITEMVKTFWAEKVIANGKSRKDGFIRLENIRKAS